MVDVDGTAVDKGSGGRFCFCSEEGRAEGCTELHSWALFSAHKKSQGPVDDALESP